MSAADANGCLANGNADIEATNSLTWSSLEDYRVKHPDATIIYANLFKILLTLFRKVISYGMCIWYTQKYSSPCKYLPKQINSKLHVFM